MQDLNTSHLGEHSLSAEMYFEEYHDKIIRRDLTVTDEEWKVKDAERSG